MAWYKQPIRPFDPVIEDDPDSKAIRYYVSDLRGTGQDSFTQPPAQDQSLWQALTNVMPPVQGVLNRRWGFSAFSLADPLLGAGIEITRMYSYQSDTTLARQILACTNGGVFSLNEDGSGANLNIFTPTAAVAPRAIVSRGTAYFFDGLVQDNLKWDSVSNATSKTGIDVVANAASGAVGPNPTTAATDSGAGGTVAWTNPANMEGGVSASFATARGTTGFISNFAKCVGFGFSVTGIISGIKVHVNAELSGGTGASGEVLVQLYKGGTRVGGQYTATLSSTNTNYAFGGSTNLWGSYWTSADINNASFGVAIQAITSGPNGSNPVVSVNNVTITVYLSTQAITFTTAAGGVTLNIGRTYYYAFKNSSTGHYSDLSQASASTGAQTSKAFNLTVPQPSGDPQVDTIVLMATADGNDPSNLFQLAEVPVGTTTFLDNTPEATLENNQLLVVTDDTGIEFGLSLNTPPPPATIGIKHKGRLYLAANQTLFFSKSVDELTMPNGFVTGRYEEAWPGTNFMDISEKAETITGLLSDGNQLYIGTQAHVRVLFGDGPLNFQKPEIVHQNAGVVNQEVWQMVFIEGTPVGAMWLTPDLRVIGSDFNTYTDVGTPIQDVLNLNTNPTNSWAIFASNGEFDLYILAIPTGRNANFDATQPDTLCVFDMRSKRWMIWLPTFSTLSAGLFNITASGTPQWLMAWTKFQNIVQVTRTDVSDVVPVTAQTAWLHFGMPTTRKLLNEIGIIGDAPNLTVTVEGASTQADFSSPATVIANAQPVLSPLGGYKVYLAGQRTKYHYYRFTFKDTTTGTTVLNAFNVKVIPINTV